MTATLAKSKDDKLTELLKHERVRHGRIEVQFLRVINNLEKQVRELTEQAQEIRSAYVASIATNLHKRNK